MRHVQQMLLDRKLLVLKRTIVLDLLVRGQLLMNVRILHRVVQMHVYLWIIQIIIVYL